MASLICYFLPFYFFTFFLPQDWFAFTGNGSQLNFTITGKEYFGNSGNPSAQNNYGFCQVKTTLFQHLAQLFVRLKLPVNLSNSNSFNNSVLHSYLISGQLISKVTNFNFLAVSTLPFVLIFRVS